MTTTYKVPASKLPADMRGDFVGDELLHVSVMKDSELVGGYTPEELKLLLRGGNESIASGDFVTCSTPEEHDALFDGIKAKVNARS